MKSNLTLILGIFLVITAQAEVADRYDTEGSSAGLIDYFEQALGEKKTDCANGIDRADPMYSLESIFLGCFYSCKGGEKPAAKRSPPGPGTVTEEECRSSSNAPAEDTPSHFRETDFAD